MTFAADDDVWVASLEDGRAHRISTDHVPVGNPRFSPDGARVAWTSRRDGDLEVYVADLGGGPAERLTYWGALRTEVAGWTPGGDVVALSSTGQPFNHLTWAHEVPLDGTAPRRLPYGPVNALAADGTSVALLTGGAAVLEGSRWRHYRGGETGRVWTGTGPGDLTRILRDTGGHIDTVLLTAGPVVFVSDHDGLGDVWSCLPDGSDVRRHTRQDAFYVRHAATDGARVVYQVAGELWLLDDLAGPDGEPRRLGISLDGAGRDRRPRLVTARGDLGDLSCDREGRASAVEVRGTIHWLTHRDGPSRVLTDRPGVRARLPRVLGKDGAVVWVTDDDGHDALELAAATGGEPRRIAAGQVGWVDELVAAPDGSTVAVAADDGRLLVVEVESGEVHELAVSDDGPVGDVVYSPDSAWLAWSHPGPLPLRRIRLAKLADRTVTDVTSARFEDTDPVFTLDGKHLAFLSWRGFDPIYDVHFFDLSFPYGCRPYLVPLAAATPSPFAPSPDGRPFGNGGDDDKKKDGEDPVVIDLEGLPDRVVPFPVEESRYYGMRAVKGGVAWLRHPLTTVLGETGKDLDADRPRPSLHRFDLAKRTAEEIVGSLSWYEVSGDGSRIVYRDEGKVRVVPSGHRAGSGDDDDDDAAAVDLSRARVRADPVAEWRQAYGEAGRIVRHHFWRPDMGGLDWDGVLDKYRPVLERILSGSDFADLLYEVFGELGTSHAYVSRGGYRADGDQVGLLGADLEPGGDGRWRVARVLPGETSDPRARSPLSAPGAAVRPGDVITAVDGRTVDPVRGPAPLLLETAGRPVELTIAPADGGDERRIAVIPLHDDSRLRYQDWVSGRRAHVQEAGGGRLGYLHIPDMMGAGWAQFHRDLRVEMPKDGLIVDLRANGGGHVSQLVVEKLARRVIGWDVPRGKRPVSYPMDAPRGPIVAVVDEHAGSDGDVIAAAIQALELGPVVGTRTWGGVVGMDGHGHGLIDGTRITVPRYATWFEGRGWGLENHGVDPDVEVVVAPADWAGGADPQLDTAIRLVLEALEARPPAAPPVLE